jgi:hypothetical protein
LPTNTEFLLVRIGMGHGRPNRDLAGHETFSGHYADDVRLLLTHRPLLP